MFYGTLRSEVNRIWTNGQAVVFDIDVKGAKHLKAQLGEKARAIFIAPPSVEVLKERLQGRGTESEESLKKRLDKSMAEMAYEKDMDLTVVNDDLEKAFTELSHRVNEFVQN
jgi:guanylate kinase